MPAPLKLTLNAVNDSILVNLDHPTGGQVNHLTTQPFTPAELAVLVRALEINRSVPESFDQAEWKLLYQWGVVSGEFAGGPDGQMLLTEAEVALLPLLRLVQDRLYQVLFGTEKARLVLALALTQTPQYEALHLQLHLPPGEPEQWGEMQLNQIPWEVLGDSQRADWWAEHRVAVSRWPRLAQAAVTVQPITRLRVLVVTSRPTDLLHGSDSDAAGMAAGLRAHLNKFPVHVRELPKATLETLSEYLYEHEKPHVLHFDGHGNFGRCCPQGHLDTSVSAKQCHRCGLVLPGSDSFSGYLAFERPDGTVDWVSASELADLLLDHGLRLVVLNACYSGLGRRGEDVFNGVAQSLIRRGLPAVVAMPFRLDWEAALEFARCFYQHLGQGDPLVEALDQSRRRLRRQRETPREWYRPALYFRVGADEQGQMFITQPAPPLGPEDPQLQRSLYIYSFEQPPRRPPEKALYWQRYFDKNRKPQRLAPAPATWQRELLPELRERKTEIGGAGPVYVQTRLPLSVALAVGSFFPQKAGYRLEFEQLPGQIWSSTTQAPDDANLPIWTSRTLPGDLSQKEAVLIIFAVNSRPKEEAILAIGKYLQEPEVFEQLATETPPLHASQRFRQVMLLTAEPAVSERRFLKEWETTYLAEVSRSYLAEVATGVETVHLFLLTSQTMAAFLGYQWDAVNAELQYHEWVAGAGLYTPSCRLALI